MTPRRRLRLSILLLIAVTGSICIPAQFGRSIIAVIAAVIIMVTSLILTAFIIVDCRHLLRAKSRERNGLCASCGYDLRGIPRRCPECGRVRT